MSKTDIQLVLDFSFTFRFYIGINFFKSLSKIIKNSNKSYKIYQNFLNGQKENRNTFFT